MRRCKAEEPKKPLPAPLPHRQREPVAEITASFRRTYRHDQSSHRADSFERPRVLPGTDREPGLREARRRTFVLLEEDHCRELQRDTYDLAIAEAVESGKARDPETGSDGCREARHCDSLRQRPSCLHPFTAQFSNCTAPRMPGR